MRFIIVVYSMQKRSVRRSKLCHQIGFTSVVPLSTIYTTGLMGIATDSYRVNKSAIPPGLVARAMVDGFSLCHVSLEIIPSGGQSCIVKARLLGKLREPI